MKFKGWSMETVILSNLIFPTLEKTLKTLNKIKEEPCNMKKGELGSK